MKFNRCSTEISNNPAKLSCKVLLTLYNKCAEYRRNIKSNFHMICYFFCNRYLRLNDTRFPIN